MHLREALSTWANLDQSSYHRSAASRQLLSLFTYTTDITIRVEIRGNMELRSIYRSAPPGLGVFLLSSLHSTFASPIIGLPGQGFLALSHSHHPPPR